MAARKPKNDLTAEQVRAALDYDLETGLFRWRERQDMRACWNSKHAGKIATYRNSAGYIGVRLNGVLRYAHRLAWLYVYGEWPDGDVDHINRDKADNRIENLRLATRSQNNANSCRPRTNTSGFKGVSWSNAVGRWKAEIRARGKRYHLGYFDTPEEAHTAYCAAAKELHGEFARVA